MAARKRKYQTESTRQKIQATQLVNRLHKIGMGTVNATPAQVTAIKTLLAKVLPDLTSSDITHHNDERTFEEVRAEMVSSYGEAITRLLLGEVMDQNHASELQKKLDGLVKTEKPKLVAND